MKPDYVDLELRVPEEAPHLSRKERQRRFAAEMARDIRERDEAALWSRLSRLLHRLGLR